MLLLHPPSYNIEIYVNYEQSHKLMDYGTKLKLILDTTLDSYEISIEKSSR